MLLVYLVNVVLRLSQPVLPNRISEEAINFVKEHITSIPKYESHYSRAQNLGKVYLNSDLTITSLYDDYYLPWCATKDIVPVKHTVYRKVFCSDFNIGFKLSKSDTCKFCDETAIKIESAKTGKNDQLVSELQILLNVHLSKAKGIQDLLKTEKESARNNASKRTSHVVPDQLYSHSIPIAESKWKWLQELKNVIDNDHHAFYDSLPFQKDNKTTKGMK